MPEYISNSIQVHIAAYVADVPKYLLLQRSMDTVVYPGIWQVVTGTIEKGETALSCALREVAEETGIIAKDMWTVPYITQFFDPKNDLIHASPVFGVLVENITDVKLSYEHQAYKWLSLDEAEKMLVLPSHIEAGKVFKRYILDNPDKRMFKIKL